MAIPRPSHRCLCIRAPKEKEDGVDSVTFSPGISVDMHVYRWHGSGKHHHPPPAYIAVPRFVPVRNFMLANTRKSRHLVAYLDTSYLTSLETEMDTTFSCRSFGISSRFCKLNADGVLLLHNKCELFEFIGFKKVEFGLEHKPREL